MNASFDTPTWHGRFQQQARWTRGLRDYLLRDLELSSRSRILEVGSGTGALTVELHERFPAQVFGVDVNSTHLGYAKSADPTTAVIRANGLSLPFPSGTFDLVCCHFLLLWVSDPVQIVREMHRVARPGRAILALAEPDYGGRIDYPAELSEIGHLQEEALRRQGADPRIGRKLPAIFHQAGISQVETGVLGGQWGEPPSQEAMELEWRVIESDLAGSISPTRLDELRRIDRTASQRSERILFVPTFYARGWKRG